jgi:hypothetical protein
MANPSAGYLEFRERFFRFDHALWKVHIADEDPRLDFVAEGEDCFLKFSGLPCLGATTVAELAGRKWVPDWEQLDHYLCHVICDDGVRIYIRGHRIDPSDLKVRFQSFNGETRRLTIEISAEGTDAETGKSGDLSGLVCCDPD